MPTLKDVLTDPLRDSEHNDCGVVASANVLNITYAEAHALLRKHGRRNRCGTKITTIRKALAAASLSMVERIIGSPIISSVVYFRRSACSMPTVAQYLRTLPKKGRFFLTSTTHGFAYINGEVMDNIPGSRMRARMHYCFEVTLKGQAAQQVIVETQKAVGAPKPQPVVVDNRPKFNPLKAELERLKAELQQPGADLAAISQRISELQARLN